MNVDGMLSRRHSLDRDLEQNPGRRLRETVPTSWRLVSLSSALADWAAAAGRISAVVSNAVRLTLCVHFRMSMPGSPECSPHDSNYFSNVGDAKSTPTIFVVASRGGTIQVELDDCVDGRQLGYPEREAVPAIRFRCVRVVDLNLIRNATTALRRCSGCWHPRQRPIAGGDRDIDV